MTEPTRGWTDEQLEALLGNVLRAGVVLAAAIVLAGGAIYLVRHGGEPMDVETFRGEPDELRTVPGILTEAVTLRGRGVIQLGLLALVATPVLRVALSAFGFLRERDWLYVGLTLFVLGVLLYSLFAGAIE
jgi:uncharacterized membrane protein